MLDSVIKANKKYYPQTLLQECKYGQNKVKTENYVNEDLEKRESDKDFNETESDIDNDSNDNETKSDTDNDESFIVSILITKPQ